jgi:predicted phage terminase large subunit-like protein
MDQIDATRLPANGAPLSLQRIVVAIDPAISTSEGSDETGIIVAAVDDAGHFYVLDDQSGRMAPAEWTRKAINAYHHWKADRIVYEQNQGGDMVASTLRNADPNVPIRGVHASRGKVTRAEPVSALYEQKRVHHVGNFPQLEDQMCSFTSDFNRNTSGYSPDRVDSLCWGITSLSGGPTREVIFTSVDRGSSELPSDPIPEGVTDHFMYRMKQKYGRMSGGY